MTHSADAAFMRRALQLARLGHGRVHPNPLVGAVVVRDGVVVGEGFHGEYGGPHAEIHAMRAAGAAARGATLYVTLEPCAHHGKTPPCTDAIIAAGVRRVVYAVADPHTRAAGGADRLRAAGIDAVGGVEDVAARLLNPVFFHTHVRQTLYVAAKLAVSLDARIAAAPGQRTPITGEPAAQETQRLRASHDAILVGSGTALVDNPLLTVRSVATPHRPTRIIVDTDARLPLDSALVATVSEAPLWLLCAQDAPASHTAALAAAGVAIIACPRTDAGIDLDRALLQLHERGVHSLLVEGGSAIFNSLLATEWLQRIFLFVAPVVLGAHGVPSFTVAPGRSWHCIDSQRLGADALITFAPAAEL